MEFSNKIKIPEIVKNFLIQFSDTHERIIQTLIWSGIGVIRSCSFKKCIKNSFLKKKGNFIFFYFQW